MSNPQQGSMPAAMEQVHETPQTATSLAAFRALYAQLTEQSLHQLPRVYSEDIEFVDPVTRHRGLPALLTYFENLLKSCEFCRFDIQQVDLLQDGYVVQWTMYYRHKNLNAGRDISVAGISRVKEQAGKIVFQRDYYDLGEMLYEHVPLLGACVRALKRRLI